MVDFDSVVVGGGVSGVAAARELATDRDVLVCERDQIAGGATALAAGEVTMVPSWPDYPAIADYATEFFRRYDGTGEFSFTECPSVELVTPEREAVTRRRVDRLSDDGLPIRYVEPDVLGERFPRLDLGEFAGGVEYGDTGYLDPYTLATTLGEDATDRGATVRTGATVTDLLVDGGAVRGVEVDGQRVTADRVVVAAGWQTREFLADHVEVPVRPYRTQCLVLDAPKPLGDDVPMGWIPGEHVYFRPEENGQLLVGGWSFAEDDPAAASEQADEGFREHAAELLPRFLDDADEARIVDGWAGCDAATPDTRPIVDAPTNGPDGLVVATGFHGRGVMTAPVTAAVVAGLVRDAEPPFPADPFALDRFDDRSADFEFFSISAGDD